MSDETLPLDDRTQGFTASGMERTFTMANKPEPSDILRQRLPETIGSYRIIRLIGEGGMGAVYEAEQSRPKRTVALKVIRPGLVSERMLRRFSFEAEVLGRLQHAGIAQIYEAGMAETTAGTQPYFAMELVQGQSLQSYVAAQKLSPRARLELLIKVCEAVHYAHQKGVIHRDLKPGNILVDESGQPKILDFGLARSTDADMQTHTMQTEMGAILGTLSYMSPEQATGNPADVDTRADVYALGVMCYEMMVGKLPFDLRNIDILEAVRTIREAEPTRPSLVDRTLRGDVETIISKALDKSKERRYQSAGDLSEDIHRYLTNEPIVARRASRWYQIQKFAARNKILVGGIAAVFVVLVLGIVGTSVGMQRAQREQRLAETAAQREQVQRRAAQNAAAEAQRQALRANQEAHKAQLHEALGMVATGDAVLTVNRAAEARQLYTDAWSALAGLKEPTFPAELGWWNVERQRSSPLFDFGEKAWAIAFSPDGHTGLTAAEEESLPTDDPHHWDLKLWDLTCGRATGRFTGHTDAVLTIAYAPDGQSVLSGGRDRTIIHWDARSGKVLHTLRGHSEKVTSVVFSPDGRRALSGSVDRTLKLWDLASGTVLQTFTGHIGWVASVAFAPDGKTVLSGADDTTLKLWDVASGQEIRTFTGHRFGVTRVLFTPDGQTALSGSSDGTIKHWDLASAKEIRTFTGTTLARNIAGAVSIALSPDGRTLLSGAWDGTVKLWDVPSGRELYTFTGHTYAAEMRAALRVAISPDGRTGLSGSVATPVKLWSVTPGRELRVLTGLTAPAYSVRFSADGRLALSGGATTGYGPRITTVQQGTNKSLKLWDVATGNLLRTFEGHTNAISSVALSPDGRTALSGSWDHTIKLWDLASGQEIRTLRGHMELVTSVDYAPDGQTALSAGGADKTVRLWDLASGKEIRTLSGHTDWVSSVAYAPDGRTAISGSWDHTIKVWDLASGQTIRTLSGHKANIHAVAFMPDGHTVLSAADDGTIKIWDILDHREPRTCAGHIAAVMSVAGSPDGRTVLSSGNDRTVRIWDAATGKELHTLGGHGGDSVAFAPDGYMAISTNADRPTLDLWDFSRAAKYRNFEPRVAAARATLATQPQDPPSLLVIGQWHAFRGMNDWAVEYLEKARAGGAAVSNLALARCYWELGNLPAATREYQRALAAGEAPEWYLKLCLAALAPAVPETPATKP